MKNRRWILKERPEGKVSAAHFEWAEEPVSPPPAGQVLVRHLYLSLDPAARIWMAGPSYMPPVEIGEVMRGIGIGVVEQSASPRLPEGDLVTGLLGWQEYATLPEDELTPIQRHPRLPLTAYLGVLGHIGLTAYFGLLEVGRPQPGETLVVSAAAGAVGSLVGQIGKIVGCHVVGIAGSDEKCRWLTGELGLDAAINYRTQEVPEALREAAPNGIDVDFENVGGEILDAVLGRLNQNARIVLCGLISQYNATQPVPGPYNFGALLTRRARLQGFIVTDYLPRAGEALPQLAQWMEQGKLKFRIDLARGLENAPETLNKLFEGANRGKLVLQVGEEGPSPHFSGEPT